MLSYFITLCAPSPFCFFFFFNDTATTEIYTLSLHDALPISIFEIQTGPDAGPQAVHEQVVRLVVEGGAARVVDVRAIHQRPPVAETEPAEEERIVERTIVRRAAIERVVEKRLVARDEVAVAD